MGILGAPPLHTPIRLGVLLALTVGAAMAQTEVSEYEVKAAFLYNFTRFVEWPSSSLQSTRNQFVIGVFGQDPFGPVLDRTVADKKVNGADLVVHRFSSLAALEPCQILFIGATEQAQLIEVLRAVQGNAVLTVGETEGFLEQGGIINLRVAERKIRFEVNADAAERFGLKISSQLLKLAIRVLGVPGGQAPAQGRQDMRGG